MLHSLCRYPGGKFKLVRPILERITQYPVAAFREAFTGGAVVGINLLRQTELQHAWFNDRDIGVYSMLVAAAHHADMLKQEICAFSPSVAEFDRIKSQLLDVVAVPASAEEIVRIAVNKIAIHQMSHGGLGQMAGGPAGGRKQTNGGITSRWNPVAICARIDAVSPLLRLARITNLDYVEVLRDERPASIYLDPPYYAVGDTLYQHSFRHVDHVRLSQQLRQSRLDWLLSYNDCEVIRELYSFACIERINVTYGTSNRRTHELLISAPQRNRVVAGFSPTQLAA